MALTRRAALLLVRTTFILLCKLLLVDAVCSFVGGWLVYFHLRAKFPSNNGRSQSEEEEDPGIQVIICGISRSGSTSLWQAMEILGFPCFHGAHLFKPSTAKLYMKALTSGAHQDWEHLLCGYRSIADYPAASSYKLLLEMYPHAKVILNVRDPESWYKSLSQTLLNKQSQNLVFEVVHPWIKRCTKVALYQKLLMDKPENKELSIINYKLHIEEVKRHVPYHKLYILDFEKNEGWAPLCKFLEVPIPNVSFPFSNKGDAFNKVSGNVLKIHIIVLISYLALSFSIIVHSWKWIFSK